MPDRSAPGAGRLRGREEQATAPGYARSLADATRSAGGVRLRVCPRRYLQSVRGGEPKGGRRTVAVTECRSKIDFVAFVKHLLEHVYATARRIHLVLDNLGTHFRICFEAALGVQAAQNLLRPVVFHYTPKHASWLNMAEIEIGILDRQCLDRRLPNLDLLAAEVAACQQRRNAEHRGIA